MGCVLGHDRLISVDLKNREVGMWVGGGAGEKEGCNGLSNLVSFLLESKQNQRLLLPLLRM